MVTAANSYIHISKTITLLLLLTKSNIVSITGNDDVPDLDSEGSDDEMQLDLNRLFGSEDESADYHDPADGTPNLPAPGSVSGALAANEQQQPRHDHSEEVVAGRSNTQTASPGGSRNDQGASQSRGNHEGNDAMGKKKGRKNRKRYRPYGNITVSE